MTPSHHEHQGHNHKHRTLSISGNDPTVLTTYHDVLNDIENVSKPLSVCLRISFIGLVI